MTTLKKIYQYRLHLISTQIHDLKAKAAAEGSEINPKHADWSKYQELKRQASLCLTAIRIMNRHHGFAPSKTDFRKELRENRKAFTTHCPKGPKDTQNAFIFEAYANLAQTEKDAKLNPTRFAEAEAYAQRRELEIAEAKAKKEEPANA